MMELAWRAQCAELDAEPCRCRRRTPQPASRFNLVVAALRTCPSCGRRIAAEHNIPIAELARAARALRELRIPDLAALSGRSRRAAALLGVAVAYAFGPTWHTVAALGFTWSLLALTLIDLDHKLLPDSITLPLLWAGLVLDGASDRRQAAVHGSALERRRRRRGLPEPLDRLSAVQARHRQGRHGLRRLQAARRDRRLARLAEAAARDPARRPPSARWSASR